MRVFIILLVIATTLTGCIQLITKDEYCNKFTQIQREALREMVGGDIAIVCEGDK